MRLFRKKNRLDEIFNRIDENVDALIDDLDEVVYWNQQQRIILDDIQEKLDKMLEVNKNE